MLDGLRFKILVLLRGQEIIPSARCPAETSLMNLHRSINTLTKIDFISLFTRAVDRYYKLSLKANSLPFYDLLTITLLSFRRF